MILHPLMFKKHDLFGGAEPGNAGVQNLSVDASRAQPALQDLRKNCFLSRLETLRVRVSQHQDATTAQRLRKFVIFIVAKSLSVDAKLPAAIDARVPKC